MSTPTVQTAYSGLPVVAAIPTNMRNPGVMSDTSKAADCFINQRFSLKLQAQLVSYVNSITGNHSISNV
jgi:hypothetical protein